MKKLQVLILIISLGICLYLVYAAQEIQRVESAPQSSLTSFISDDPENAISLQLNAIQTGNRFQLTPTGKGQFQLTYDNLNKDEVSIQVYDVIGNLLLEEDSNHEEIQRQYDLSESGSRLFVVKVDNQEVARIKKVTAG
ncbi:MAG: hypothetical protein RIC80_00550 [Cyclobacteriaceae bacterium]